MRHKAPDVAGRCAAAQLHHHASRGCWASMHDRVEHHAALRLALNLVALGMAHCVLSQCNRELTYDGDRQLRWWMHQR